MNIDVKKNHIVCGDNLEWLKSVPDESVDLCYIDPPFFSSRNYEVIWGNGYELRSFGDRFAGGISHYIEWMRPRIELIHRKLKKDGAIFLHCDGHASHRLRCALDDIFGEDNFINEIIWRRQSSHNNSKQGSKHFGRIHDAIYFYSKSKDYQYDQQYEAHDEEYVKKAYRFKDEDGRRYRLGDLSGPGGAAKGNPKYEVMGVTRYWRYSEEKMKQLIKEGRIVQTSPGAVPAYKRYLDEMKGNPLQSVWSDLDPLQSMSGERLGYPTQKPEALIKRILLTASKEGDVILDCFAGGGTTAKVAADLNRRFIVGDVSPVAVKIMAERLLFDCPKIEFEIKNLPQTEGELKDMDGHRFAETVCEVMGWEVNERKSGDGGVDAWAGDGSPVQIKNHSKSAAGRPDLQKFVGALHGKKAKKGIFVAWDFSKDAMGFIADMKREHSLEILPMKCSEVFGGLLLDHTRGKEIETLYLERRPKNWASGIARAKDHKKPLDKAAAAKQKTTKGKTRKDANQ